VNRVGGGSSNVGLSPKKKRKDPEFKKTAIESCKTGEKNKKNGEMLKGERKTAPYKKALFSR